ncbi:MAG: hypothetical protein ACT4OZ_12035 [Gemmatimonadota bacterium]
MARFIQPDHDRGDVNTIAGYASVHGRPAAFEGSDGCSYSVSIEESATGEEDRPWGAWFLFVKWRRTGPQGVEGHLETQYFSYGKAQGAAAASLGSWPLAKVKEALDEAISGSHPARQGRRWWDAMNDEAD